MNNSIFSFPIPANEPVKSYLAGSPERIALEAELERQSSTVVDIPLIIGGKEITSRDISQFETAWPIEELEIPALL